MVFSNNDTLVNIVKNRACNYLDNQQRSKYILDKMLEVDRIRFLPEEMKKYAYLDEPLSIGFNQTCSQTCSQPSMVAFILDKLEIKPGNSILEIGSGCGYAAAIASKLCGNTGKVWAIEIIPELISIMKNNLMEEYPNISIINKDGSTGLPTEMPFDRIFLSAGVCSDTFNNDVLLNQLTDNGILIYPEKKGNLYKNN